MDVKIDLPLYDAWHKSMTSEHILSWRATTDKHLFSSIFIHTHTHTNTQTHVCPLQPCKLNSYVEYICTNSGIAINIEE